METATTTLWEEYSRTKDTELKRQLVMEYIGVVKFVVSKFRSYSRQSDSVIDEQDLLQLGMLGLLDSIERFDPTRGVKFETYAITRIRGTVQDELRKLDWVPRSVREKVRTLDRAAQKIHCSDILEQSAKKIASELSLTVDEYIEILHETQVAIPDGVARGDVSDQLLENVPDDDADFLTRYADHEVRTILARMVENLPQQDRLVISLYYYEELTFKEIANILKLSESRIFQKHAAIMKRIREQVEALV